MDFDPKKFEIRKLTREDISAFHSLLHLFNIVFEEDETAIGTEANLLTLLSNSHFVPWRPFTKMKSQAV